MMRRVLKGVRRAPLALLLGIFVVLGAACGSSASGGGAKATGTAAKGATSKKLPKVTLLWPVAVPTLGSAEYLIAEQNGYFEKAGVNVKVQYGGTGASTATSLSVLNAGTGNVVIGDPASLESAVHAGADLVSIYQLAYDPPFGIGFFANSKYKSISQLAGAKVGVYAATGATPTILKYALLQAHVNPSSVTELPIGTGASSVAAMKAGQVDAAVVQNADVPSLRAEGIPISFQAVAALQNKWPGALVVARRDEVTQDRPALVAFLRGLAMAQYFCSQAANAKSCAQTYASASGSKLPLSVLEEGIQQYFGQQVLPAEAHGTYGYTSPLYWRTVVDVNQVASGQPSVPPSKLYTTALSAAVNANLTLPK